MGKFSSMNYFMFKKSQNTEANEDSPAKNSSSPTYISQTPKYLYIKLLEEEALCSIIHGIYAKTVCMHVMVKSLSSTGQNTALTSDEQH